MVRVENRKGLFLVMRVDVRQGVADLTQKAGKAEILEENVPLQLIRPVPRDASKAIHAFLLSSSGTRAPQLSRPDAPPSSLAPLAGIGTSP
jgi:hypothetical protein